MVDVEPLDELAIDQDDALALRLSLGIRVDDASGKSKLILGGCEYFVRSGELLRVNQGLSVKAKLSSLTTGIDEPVRVV